MNLNAITLAITRPGGVRSWDPLSLFTGSTVGVWYDPSDLLTPTTVNTDRVLTGIQQASVSNAPGKALFADTLIDDRPLGDINNNGVVTSADVLAYAYYQLGTATQAETDYINNVMHPYILANPATYAAYINFVGGTLYRDAAGTTPVTAVEQPVGLMLDKSKGLVLGPELITTPLNFTDSAAWTSAATSVTQNTFTIGSAGGVFTATNKTVSGKSYQLQLVWSATASVTMEIRNGNSSGSPLVSSQTGTGGTLNCVLPSAATAQVYLRGVGGATYTITLFSVRELPGNHAFNGSGNSANFPVLSARKNLLLATAVLSTQSVTTRAVGYVLSFWGTGTITLSGTSTAGPLVGTGASDRVYIEFTPTAGTLTVTVSGSVLKAQLEEINETV